jgi:hypothetical protein
MDNITTAWKISDRGLDDDGEPGPDLYADLYVYRRADGTGGVRLPDGTEWFRTNVEFLAEPCCYLDERGVTIEVIDPASMPPSARS